MFCLEVEELVKMKMFGQGKQLMRNVTKKRITVAMILPDVLLNADNLYFYF